jgi:hypothetical protein
MISAVYYLLVFWVCATVAWGDASEFETFRMPLIMIGLFSIAAELAGLREGK